MYVNDGLRLMAGFFVLLSLALGYAVHQGFYLFTAIVGLNLLQSGLTHRCPAMWILKRAGMKECPHDDAALLKVLDTPGASPPTTDQPTSGRGPGPTRADH